MIVIAPPEADPVDRVRAFERGADDVLERPLTVSGIDEASARGAAVVALERLGGVPEPAPLGRVVEPRAERFAALREARSAQRELYDAVVPQPI